MRTRGHPASAHPPVPPGETCERGESSTLCSVSFFPLISLTSTETVLKVIDGESEGAERVGAADYVLLACSASRDLVSRPPPASMERSDEISVLERHNVISLLRYFHGE